VEYLINRQDGFLPDGFYASEIIPLTFHLRA